MLLDKFRWARFHGHWFAIFGGLNALAYGLHLIMDKDNYKETFAYRADNNRMFGAVKSMMGSDNWKNVIWTATALIGLNFYLH